MTSNPFSPRRVGLSRFEKPRESLLRQIGGKKVDTESAETVNEKVEKSKMKEPSSIDAPPLSSDDEDEKPVTGSQAAPTEKKFFDDDDDELDEGWNNRQNIKKTVFRKNNQTPFSHKARSRARLAQPSISQRRTPSENSTASGSPERRTDPVHGEEEETPHTDKFGFTRDSAARKKRQHASQFGPGKIRPPGRSKTMKYGQNPQKSSQSQTQAPQRNTSPERPVFKSYDMSSPDSKSPAHKRFKTPATLNSSPDVSSRKSKPKFQHHGIIEDESPEKPKFSLPGSDFDDLLESATSASREIGSLTSRSALTKPVLSSLDHDSDFGNHDSNFVAFVAENKLHDTDDDDDDDGLSEQAEERIEYECPICHERVDRQLLEKYQKNGRMSLQKQIDFCRSHKQKAAASSGAKRGYPKIDWNTAEEHFDAHIPYVQCILEGKQASYFAEALRSKVVAGEERMILKTKDVITPGYYGPRGLRAMTEFLIKKLSSIIRKRAVEDSLISARGYTGYVQAVLVPELAVRLIMEDMSVGEEEAREIMRDSVDVGMLLHEELKDRVADGSDEED